MSAGRVIVSLAAALLLVTGLGYAASQTIAARPAVDQGRPPYVPSPAPADAGRRWLATTAQRTGIPAPALRAYARVQRDGGAGCGVGWTTLAGIGWVESHHGTLGDRVLHRDGRSSSHIIGPALDGTGAFAAVPATSGSAAFHGDARWEHAVGPLQFLPETWSRFASDGDHDGRADPHDLDDAAAAAARYLCASSGDLTTDHGWSTAVLSYNHSEAYLDEVHEAAVAYALRSAR